MICLILRSQHLCFAVARIFARCVRARTARESSRRRLDPLSSSLSCRKGRHMALGMGFSRGPPFAVLRSVYQTAWGRLNPYNFLSSAHTGHRRGNAHGHCFFRTIILYLLLIAGLRLTGKRQIGELEPIELVLTMLLSDLASVPMQDFDSPLINGVVPILTLLALTTLLSYISFRSGRFRSLICGEPAIVVRCGRLQQRAMRHNRMTVDELMEELRGQGVTNLKDVKYAVLETSGQVSVLLRSDAQPVTPAQLSMNAADDPFLPVLLINDGRLLRNNMKKMDVDDAWLRQQLKREHLKDPSQVFLLSLDQGGNVICQAKEDV